MAFNFRELNFILGLRTDKFLEGAKKAEQSANESRGKVERPFHLTAKVDNVITSFAKVGLAIDGLKKTYNLFIGPAKRMVELSNIQEKADTKLASALKTRNIYTEENFKLLKDQASAIQSVTTSGDEQNEMLQALAINMGITFDKIDEVTKGSIGLAASFAEAGLNQETALKGIALAYQGNFTQLQRYIPALRETKNETEKMAILQQAMKDGFIQAQDAAKDGAGQMEQFSNILGDVQEVGGDLVKEALLPILKLLKPIAESIASVDAGTRNAVIGLAAFFLIVSKGRTTLLGMRAAIIALNASIGPAGWLIIGIGAAATALGIYAASTDTAAKSNLSLKNSNLDVADSFNKVKQAAEKAYGKESIENTLKVLAYFKKEVLDSRKIYEDLINKQKSGDKEVTQDMS